MIRRGSQKFCFWCATWQIAYSLAVIYGWEVCPNQLESLWDVRVWLADRLLASTHSANKRQNSITYIAEVSTVGWLLHKTGPWRHCRCLLSTVALCATRWCRCPKKKRRLNEDRSWWTGHPWDNYPDDNVTFWIFTSGPWESQFVR